MQQEISVIIPFYNRLRYLPDALESVFFQTSGDIELILVNDGSTDDSLEAARQRWESLCNDYPKKRAAKLLSVNIPHSGMPGLVRNRGVELATAPLIAFLDSDDRWLPQKLERQLPLHEHVRISHTRERWLRALRRDEQRNGGNTEQVRYREVSQKTQRHRREGDIFQDALQKCIIGPSTVIMERSLFEACGGFREDMEVAEDYEFWLRITAREEVGYVNEPLVEKRAGMPHQNQLSERYDHIETFRVQALRHLLETSGICTSRQEKQSREVLQRKMEIVRRGAEKRGRTLEATLFQPEKV